jgi:hypothetical protein
MLPQYPDDFPRDGTLLDLLRWACVSAARSDRWAEYRPAQLFSVDRRGGLGGQRGRNRHASAGIDPVRGLRISAGIAHQPTPQFASDLTTVDIMVETLIALGATHCFGILGDGINSTIEALRKRQDRIKYISVGHEEAAAFKASGAAKHAGQLGVCVGTTGPGAVHVLNGLYDAQMDSVPVVAITGMSSMT